MQTENNIRILGLSSDEYDGSTEYVYCPLCRQRVNDVTEESYDILPCSHLLFAYQTFSGDYEYIEESVEERISKIDKDELDDDGLLEVMAAAGYGNDLVVVDVCSSGMACGPVSHSVYFGFDCGGRTLDEKELDELRSFILEQAQKESEG